MSNILNKIKNRIHYYRYLKTNNVNAVFIVSTGRTGTNFFESFFNQLNNYTHAVHEPQPDFFDLSMNKIRNNWSDNKIEKYITENRQKYLIQLSKYRTKRYVECNPFLPLLLPNIKNVFKKAQFIVITRDAKSYVKSALNKSPIDNGKMFFYAENDGRLRLRALDYKDDAWFNEWETFSRMQKIAWFWNKTNLQLLNFYKNNKSVTLHVKFENIFSADLELKKKSISSILTFLKIKPDVTLMAKLLQTLNTKSNATQEEVYKGYDDWSSEEQQ
ncbi:MAG: sulfotransferase domain-containing protein, partial [Vicingaceae bacterium]|nr:sulfotransferase domain-containing protein [Vicingaceae bacterium]